MIEHGEEDAVHRGSIREDAHWAGAASDFAEASFNGVGRADGPARGEGFVSPASQQFIEIVTQAGDRARIIGRPAVREAARGGTRPRHGGGRHDGVQIGLDGGLVTNPDLGQDITDLVRPAALHRNGRIGGRQRGEQPGGAIEADHLEPVAGQPAADQVTQETLPFGGALALSQAEVDDLLLAVMPQSEGDQDGLPAPVRRASTTPSSISTRY